MPPSVPACGYSSVTRIFRDSLRKILAKKDCIDIIKDVLLESAGKDESEFELICRSLIETCINDGVIAFQKYCEGMTMVMEKRYLLAHNEGIVDAKYIQKSGDVSYQEGQRIVVSAKDVENLVFSLENLAVGIQIERSNA